MYIGTACCEVQKKKRIRNLKKVFGLHKNDENLDYNLLRKFVPYSFAVGPFSSTN